VTKKHWRHLLHTESTYTVACPPPMSSQTTLAQRSSGTSDKRGLSYKRTCSTFACVRVVVGVWKRVRVGAWHARTRRTSARGMHDEQEASMHRGGKHACRGKPGLTNKHALRRMEASTRQQTSVHHTTADKRPSHDGRKASITRRQTSVHHTTADKRASHDGRQASIQAGIHHIIAQPRMHQEAGASKGEEGAWRAAHLLAGAATFEDNLKQMMVLGNVVLLGFTRGLVVLCPEARPALFNHSMQRSMRRRWQAPAALP
jgi:hypothetical protein